MVVVVVLCGKTVHCQWGVQSNRAQSAIFVTVSFVFLKGDDKVIIYVVMYRMRHCGVGMESGGSVANVHQVHLPQIMATMNSTILGFLSEPEMSPAAHEIERCNCLHPSSTSQGSCREEQTVATFPWPSIDKSPLMELFSMN